jgi:alkanesulfonate monooxygenase SsuD/methylene tetrahydromethanopterin reductase-like flavin-dependent oxidoreductase (luciferase family)
MVTFGVIFPPDQPPESLLAVARATEAAGIPQLWLWEDCFKESGLAPAAAALAATQRLTVGIGLLPVPLRNAAITAMELATVERMFPGRLRPGLGHGVLDWMGQVGARVASPLTLLREYTDAVRRLLHGERLDVDGRYVHLHDVALDWPPEEAPPVLVGAQRPKTLAVAGELGDGVILTGEETPDVTAGLLDHVREARGHLDGFDVVNFATVQAHSSVDEVVETVRAYAAVGVTTVPVVVVAGPDGPPAGEAFDLAGWVADVGAEVQRRLTS